MKDWIKILLKPTDTIETAIRVLHSGGARIALIVDENRRLLGTVTDGDIRRSLIDHITMDCIVKKIMNDSPSTALMSDSSDLVMSMMKSKALLHIPLVNSDGVLVGLETLHHLLENKKYDNPVFLMAGGYGTRLHPLTKDTPKPLLDVGGRPILETILGRFIKSGFHNFYISTFYKAEKVRKYFGDGSSWGVNINYINEDKPLGTAGSIGLLPSDLPDLPVLMMNGDVLTKVNFEHLLSFHKDQLGIATMCIREYDIQIPFGVVDIEKNKVKGFLEKPVKKFFINAGIYVFEKEMINSVKVDQYIDMPNLLEQQIKKGKNVSVFPIHEYWKDVGQMKDYQSANNSFANEFSLDD